MLEAYFVGVDVGTGSVRAGLVACDGQVIKQCKKEIKTWNPAYDYYEQSSDDIWSACVFCVKSVCKDVDKKLVKGVGFTATCSLVVVDKFGEPLSVSLSGKNEQNIILWMDHRASEEAIAINKLNHRVLKYVGGKISPEMETPKLMWLKKNLRERCWNSAGYFFDLPDFLTWKATNSNSRSLCSLVCKWTYEIDSDGRKGWSRSYLKEIGLEDLMDDFGKIGADVFEPGTPVGHGLVADVALEMGLLPGTPVGASIIDAHAGGLGLVGCAVENVPSDFHTRLSLICGTSTCHMVVSKGPVFVPGVWGPYFSAMVPGMWLNEGGQSATGKLVDYVIETHPATPSVLEKVGNGHIQNYLCELLEKMAEKRKLKSLAYLTKDVHMLPDFHGNRSPVADPNLKGMICGLTLSADEDNLALLYLATLQALSYGTKHILETLVKSGHSDIRSILICGGLAKSPLFVQTQADVAGLPVIQPKTEESVLLGSAILGACAAGHFADMKTAITSMGGTGIVVHPDKEVAEYHRKKYDVFLRMLDHQYDYKKIMEASE